MKSTAPFTSSTTQVPTSAGRRSTPTRSPPTARSGRERDGARFGRRHDRLASRAERDVRPPLARRGDALHRSDHAPARDDETQVVAARGDELLRDRTGRVVPRPTPAARRARGRSTSSSSQRTTSRPHDPKRGLKTIGASSSGNGSHGATCTVRGCGTPAANIAARGGELVVRARRAFGGRSAR